MFWLLLGYNVGKACASLRNSTWFTRLFLPVRRWGLGTRLVLQLPTSLWTHLKQAKHVHFPCLAWNLVLLLPFTEFFPLWRIWPCFNCWFCTTAVCVVLARFSAASISGRLLSEGGVYFFGKPTDINNGWIRYVWVIEWRLLDAVSWLCSLSVLLSPVEMGRTTRTALAWWPS